MKHRGAMFNAVKAWRSMRYKHGMVWCGMVWYGMTWYGMVWHSMVQYVGLQSRSCTWAMRDALALD